MKATTLRWLTRCVQTACSRDSIVFVIIAHGASSGSVVIGGEKEGGREMSTVYLTIPEVKKAATNIPNGSYSTLINTACFSGGWTHIAKESKGNRFVHTATSNCI